MTAFVKINVLPYWVDLMWRIVLLSDSLGECKLALLDFVVISAWKETGFAVPINTFPCVCSLHFSFLSFYFWSDMLRNFKFISLSYWFIGNSSRVRDPMVFFFISLYQLRRILFRLRILFSFLSEQWIVFNSANERTFSCRFGLVEKRDVCHWQIENER